MRRYLVIVVSGVLASLGWNWVVDHAPIGVSLLGFVGLIFFAVFAFRWAREQERRQRNMERQV